jgi:N-acetylglucosaminyl-diphospho-decaprenol L-rhamnosyltransferase
VTARPGAAPPAVDVVVVNWNTDGYLRSCLAALAGSTGPVRFGRVVVVDNASTDGSADLPAAFDGVTMTGAGAGPADPAGRADLAGAADSTGRSTGAAFAGAGVLPVTVVSNPTNRGFAAACNQGARLGSAPYLLLLNPDTVVRPDAVAAAAGFLESRAAASVGICGGAVSRPDGSAGIAASRFPTLGNVAAGVVGLDRIAPRLFPPRHLAPAELAESRPVDQVIGAFFLVRRGLWDQLRGLDERYFLYYEEVDFCRRARALGWGTQLLVDAQLVHVANVSSRRSGGRALGHSLCSRTRYAARHWTRPETAALVALTLGVELPLRLLRAVPHGGAELRAVADAGGSYLRFLLSGGRDPAVGPAERPVPVALPVQPSRSGR